MKKFIINILLGIKSKALRVLNPSFSYCSGCKIPWNYCTPKSVMYSPNSGTFATCNNCWNNLSLEKLKEHYTNVYFSQEKDGDENKHTLLNLLKCVEEEYYLTRNT